MPPATALLFLDASGAAPAAGVWRDGAWLAFRRDTGRAAPPVETLFALAAGALEDASDVLAGGVNALGGFVFVEGPGSVLGIRAAALAVRCWTTPPAGAPRPVFAVGALALAARLLARTPAAPAVFTLVSDSRRGFWNTVVARAGDGAIAGGGFDEADAGALAALPRPRFHVFRRPLGAPPADCEPFPDGLLERDPGALAEPGLLRLTAEPDAVNIPNVYAKWTPARHRRRET